MAVMAAQQICPQARLATNTIRITKGPLEALTTRAMDPETGCSLQLTDEKARLLFDTTR